MVYLRVNVLQMKLNAEYVGLAESILLYGEGGRSDRLKRWREKYAP